MESQITAKNLKINLNKNTGIVVLIVEGEKDEFAILKNILTNIFDYNYIPMRRNRIIKEKYESKSGNNSTFLVVNTNNSNISSIEKDEEYLDKIHNILKSDYSINLKNTPIYFLWDRDHESNNENFTRKMVSNLSNAYDNDNYDTNGLLLLSYPCVEVFEISNFDKNLWRKRFKNSEESKHLKNAKRYNADKINASSLLLSVENMHRALKMLGINSYDPSNFKRINTKVFENETGFYNDFKSFIPLSLICIMFIDLGMISEIPEFGS